MNGRILVVDDEASLREVVRRALEPEDYEILECADGDEAIGVVERMRPTLLLLDVHMPRLDGLEVLKAVMEACPETGVIVMTADWEKGLARQAMNEGACDFLVKPFDLDHLRTTVMANIIARRRLQKA